MRRESRVRLRRGVSALIVAVAALSPSALGARPAGATARVVKTFKLAPGLLYDAVAGLGSMWFIRDDEANTTLIYRVNPKTNRMKRVAKLEFPTGGAAVGFHSLWLADYYGDGVYRLSPSGRIQARIRTGLQPQNIQLAFGSVWVSNHHGHSVTRIDPRTNRVIATASAGARQFRDGPQQMTSDGHRLYVGSSDLQKLQRISPASNRTFTPTGSPLSDAFCEELDYAGGWIWSDDISCTDSLYRLDRHGRVVQTISYGTQGGVGSMSVLGSVVWVAADQRFNAMTYQGHDAVLRAYRSSTGRLLCRDPVGGDSTTLGSGFGDLWMFDAHHVTIRRIRVSAPACR
jgi:streptogramin lyase